MCARYEGGSVYVNKACFRRKRQVCNNRNLEESQAARQSRGKEKVCECTEETGWWVGVSSDAPNPKGDMAE